MVHYRPKNKFCLQELGRALSLFKRRETYTRRNFYTRNLFTKTFLTERNFYFFVFTERRFCTQRFLHRETFTSTMAAGNLHPQNRISVRKTKNDFKTFFSHVTKDFKKGKSSAPMEKKKPFSCSHARYYCGTLTRPFHCDLHLFFRAFFFAGRQATGLSGGHAAWGILLSPHPPAAANPEGYGGRAQTAALAIAWRAMEHTYPELGTGHCCRHPPPPPAAATNNNGSCFDLEIDVVVSTRWCNIFPNAQLGQPWIH